MRRRIWILLMLAGVLGADAETRTLALPQVPAELMQPAERADYLALHFWDAMDFGDLALIDDAEFMEQTMVDFLSILLLTSDDVHKSEALDKLLSRCNADNGSLAIISDLAKKYLYETESPMLNEDTYELYIRSLMHNHEIGESERLRYEYVLHEIARNRPGTKAQDMSLNTADGTIKLSDLMGRMPAIVLMYDHDCDFCHETIDEMINDARMAEKTAADKLVVVAIDVNDEKTTNGHKKQMPNWIWTSAINDIDENFSTRSIPSVYVLAPDMTILIKDSSYANVSAAIFH